MKAASAVEKHPLRRWLTFNAVGGVGIVLQLSILAVLTSGAKLHYLVSTAIAVEITVLHNFIRHEQWTWRDRARADGAGFWKRLFRFQTANGAFSVGGNL